MTFPVLAAFLIVVAVAFFVAASRSVFWDSYGKAALDILLGIVFLAAGLGAGFIALTLGAYQRLSGDEHVTQVQFVRKGDKVYTAMFTYPGPRIQVLDMKGDDWQVDARMLKWNGPSNLLGFSTLYRMDQITPLRQDRRGERRRRPALRPPERRHLAARTGSKEWIESGWMVEERACCRWPTARSTRCGSRRGRAARPLNDAAKKGWGRPSNV